MRVGAGACVAAAHYSALFRMQTASRNESPNSDRIGGAVTVYFLGPHAYIYPRSYGCSSVKLLLYGCISKYFTCTVCCSKE